MKKIFLILVVAFTFLKSFSQNVGIGTTNPNPKAILDVKATDKGILFPRMTTVQRDAIANPPNGLHIFNTDEHCLNYYDSVYAIWNCYCNNCQTPVFNVAANTCHIDFYNTYAKNSPAKTYVINILAGVTVSACFPSDTALSFKSMPFNAVIIINNYGTIIGGGGDGGKGTIESSCPLCVKSADSGMPGGDAVSTRAGVQVKINNYGLIAAGGGSGAFRGLGYGGGGGGGGGFADGTGGGGGGLSGCNPPPFQGCTGTTIFAGNGLQGFSTSGGNGGAGASAGGAGGRGGDIGMAGANGIGNIAGNGGAAGKAIGGGSGNMIINFSNGASFGAVD